MKKRFYIFEQVTHGDWGQSSLRKINQPKEGFEDEDLAETFINSGLLNNSIHLNDNEYLLVIKCYSK